MQTEYKPIVKSSSGPYRGTAMVGTHSAIIGWTFDDIALRDGLRGFAIRRTDLDPDTGEIMRLDWLGGYKRFKETDNGKIDNVRSLEAPFQRFRWNDYTLNASRSYLYEVFPMRGPISSLTRDEAPLRFEIRPSAEDDGGLGVFVNRGVTASIAYLERFRNQHPADVGPSAYQWLSRGLKESLLGLIASANSGDALHVAIYEFFDDEIAQSLKDAIVRQVGVHIVHDAKSGKHSTEKSEKVIQHHGLQDHRTKRTTVNISHNKVVIRLVDGTPKEVWTGSANFSENAFNFQTNTALIVRDPDALRHFETYFQALLGNPPKKDSKITNIGIMTGADAESDRFADRTFFSPIKNKNILETSVDLIRSAESMVLISAPFGVDQTMIDAVHQNSDDIVEYGLVNATAKKKVASFHRRSTRFFTPSRLNTYMGRKWDAKAFGAHKIHAKTIIVDPLGDNPKVFIGSANFSKASCSDNDENAMLIVGNKRLSSIITTEFMRIYDHYKSRYYIDIFDKGNKEIKKENRKRKTQGLEALPLNKMDTHLKSDKTWSKTAFDPHANSHKYRDRIAFSGG